MTKGEEKAVIEAAREAQRIANEKKSEANKVAEVGCVIFIERIAKLADDNNALALDIENELTRFEGIQTPHTLSLQASLGEHKEHARVCLNSVDRLRNVSVALGQDNTALGAVKFPVL